MFLIGILLGIMAGLVRVLYPSIQGWALPISLLMGGDLAVGFLISESSIGGVGSIISAAYTPNLSNPFISEISLEDRVKTVGTALGQYIVTKTVILTGFIILILIGVKSMKIDVWPLSALLIILFIIPTFYKRVEVRKWIPYTIIISLLLMASVITVKMGGKAPVYTVFACIFTLARVLAGFEPMPRQELEGKSGVDLGWAFVGGLAGAFFIGMPGSVVLDPAGDKDDYALYVENAVASGVSEGFSIGLLLVGFGSRDALSSTLSLWLNEVSKWQAISILGVSILVGVFFYSAFAYKILHHYELNVGSNRRYNKKGRMLPTLCISFFAMLLASNWIVCLLLTVIGIAVWKLGGRAGLNPRDLGILIPVLAIVLIGV